MGRSVCIIGAGIGGLMAGAYLAAAGFQVTVVEKATTVGGSAGWYVRKNRTFPTGATIAFGLEQKGLLREMLEELEISIDAKQLAHPMDVVLPDRTVSIYQDENKWEEELVRAFPEQNEKVMSFWRELAEIGELILAITKTGVSLPLKRGVDLGKLPSYIMTHPTALVRLIPYALSTVEDLLKKHRLEKNTAFCQFLNAQLLDAAQTDVTKAALLPASAALTIYRNGSFVIENGLGGICQALATYIEEAGGTIALASPVLAATYQPREKCWHIQSQKITSCFDIVINNSGISFGFGTSYAEKKEFSWGALRIDGIVNADFWERFSKGKELPFAFQIMPDEKDAAVLDACHGPIYVTLNKAVDKNGNQVKAEIMVTASIHTYPEKWFIDNKEIYKEKKKQAEKALIGIINKTIPVKEHLLYAETGTPSTYLKFIGKAEVGGFPLTVNNAILKPKSVRSRQPQWFIVGEHAFPGPGTLSSALSGYYAARAIKKQFLHHEKIINYIKKSGRKDGIT